MHDDRLSNVRGVCVRVVQCERATEVLILSTCTYKTLRAYRARKINISYKLFCVPAGMNAMY